MDESRNGNEPPEIPEPLLWDKQPPPRRSMAGLVVPLLMIGVSAALLAVAAYCALPTFNP